MSAQKKLTTRQQEIYDLIANRIRECGSPPTRSEIAQIMGFKSANAAEDHLKALARRGVVQLIPGCSRGIRLVSNESGLPVFSLTTNKSILENENATKYINVENKIFIPHADLAVVTKDDSMSLNGIYEQDLVFIHLSKEIMSGQTCLVKYQGEFLIRKLTMNGSSISLIPTNSNFPSINIGANADFSIEGVCVGVLRTQI